MMRFCSDFDSNFMVQGGSCLVQGGFKVKLTTLNHSKSSGGVVLRSLVLGGSR